MRTITTFLLGWLLAGLAAGCAAEGRSFLDPADPLAVGESAPAALVPLATAATLSPPAAGVAAAPPAPRIDDPAPPADGRLVVYNAAYRVVVADVAAALRALREAAEKAGGYMQEISGGAITVRVPAARFNETIRFVEETGEVVERHVQALDVTEEMRDLRIRLDNAEQLRKRLLDILAKADKVEDAIKVEAELARVSEQIDAAKGKIRFLDSRLAFSTIRVELNSPARPNAAGTGPRLPFAWVERLGEGLVGQVQQEVRKAGIFGHGPGFRPPPGFVRYYEDDRQVDAMDAGGLRVRVQRHPNADEAGIEFWAKLVRRSLVDGRSLAVAAEESPGSARLLRGTRDAGGKRLGYLAVVKRTGRWVTVFEAWGPVDEFDANYTALRAAALSVEE